MENEQLNQFIDNNDKNRRTNIVKRRERIKSFIEFDDDPDNDDNLTNDNDKRFSDSIDVKYLKNKNKLEYCKNDLITVFQQQQQQEEKNENNDNDDEWNDFQRSDDNVQQKDDNDDDEVEEQNLNNNDNDDENDEYNDDDDDVSETESNILYGKLNQMEQEQELLNNSLIALTSHFAQVQLRLRQIVEAKNMDNDKRELLLTELETFANRGIPELMLCTTTTTTNHSLTQQLQQDVVGCTNLQRSISMATSLMADDVFEDDNDNAVNISENYNTDENNFDKNLRNSWSYSQSGHNYYDSSIHSGITSNSKQHHSSTTTTTMLITEEKLEKQRNRQKELIEQLKDQLEDLERYAYETGELNSLPSSMLLERQNAIIEQIKSKLPILSIDEIDQLTPEQLRQKVDHAIKELVNPVIMKEQLVTQLKTQVTDLERFIQFLQQNNKKKRNEQFDNNNKSYLMNFLSKKQPNDNNRSKNLINNNNNNKQQQQQQNNNETAANIFKRILSLLQIFAWTQMGHYNSKNNYTNNSNETKINLNNFKQNLPKRTIPSCARHWGDLRAQLEISITSIIDFYNEQKMNYTTISSSNNDNNDDCQDFISLGNTTLIIDNYFVYEQLTVMVRKDLTISLRNLINHGLIGQQQQQLQRSNNSWINNSNLIDNGTMSLTNSTIMATSTATTIGHLFNMGIGCFSTKSSSSSLSTQKILPKKPIHAWQLILYYYELKNGSKFRSMPNRKLSQSFGLQSISGYNQTNPKHCLFAAIDEINDTHTRLKRSLDSHFKAFVCRGLNQQMLSQWLRLILRNSTIINDCYEKWSYTASTGFEDALRQLDRLSNLRFCLPADLAVRQLQSIHDAF